MTALLQLEPPIPLTTPLGRGVAWLVIDYGVELDLRWVVADERTGRVYTWSNRDVRAQANLTEQRRVPEIPEQRRPTDV